MGDIEQLRAELEQARAENQRLHIQNQGLRAINHIYWGTIARYARQRDQARAWARLWKRIAKEYRECYTGEVGPAHNAAACARFSRNRREDRRLRDG